MNGFSRITAALLLVLGLIFSTNSFGRSEFNVWSEAYLRLGIHPTEDEIRSKCKALKMNDAQTEGLIDADDGSDAFDVIRAHDEEREVYLNAANIGKESKSKTTANMSLKVLALLEEVKEEKQSRNVKKYLITEKKLERLMAYLPKRIDSEENIQSVKKMIDEMNSDGSPLGNERVGFLKEVDSYFETSKNENFDTKKYTQGLIDRFNDHIQRVDRKINADRAQNR